MIWTRFDISEWTVGVAFDDCITLHIGPLKVGWVRRGTGLYKALKRTRASQ